MSESPEIYLQPTRIIDSDSPLVINYAMIITDGDFRDPVTTAVTLYNSVRDEIGYNPYVAYHRPESYQASNVLRLRKGYCVSKASLLCALGRVCGIPSRIGFATVRNHIATRQLIDLIGTNKFVYHGFTEFLLNGKWVKATPAFDAITCQRHKVEPLEFDGLKDSINHQYNNDKQLFMEYLEFHGSYADIPVDKIMSAFRETYGNRIVDQWVRAFDSLKGISQRKFENEEVIS